MTDQPTDETTKRPATSAPAARPPRPSRKAEAEARAAAKLDAQTAAAGREDAPAGAAAPTASRRSKGRTRVGTSAHDKRVRRFLLRLSLLNWGIAIVAWTISAFLGITSPASIIVYSVLFVIGLVAAILAILTYLLEKFGHEPESMGAVSGGHGGAGDDASAAKGDTAAPAAT